MLQHSELIYVLLVSAVSNTLSRSLAFSRVFAKSSFARQAACLPQRGTGGNSNPVTSCAEELDVCGLSENLTAAAPAPPRLITPRDI